MSEKLRVLIADDSAITRGLFEKAFALNGYEIAGLVSNGRKALDFCRENPVDFVLSDYDMPEMNGIEAGKIISGELGIPFVIYSDDIEIRNEALNAGAAFFIKKPALSAYNAESMKDFVSKIASGIKNTSAASKKITSFSRTVKESHPFSAKTSSASFKVLCIGASTGGPTAVQKVLSGLGNNFPLPVLYAQHLDVGSDEKMARWFCDTCPNIPMSLAKDGEVARPGHAYLAPADTHLVIDYVKADLPVLRLSKEPPEHFLRPAVNKLFRSASKHYGNDCLAVLMTGMGRDGAEGCREIVSSGGFTVCEDKSTCTVFGMPAAAIELNAATEVLPREKIAGEILRLVNQEM